MDRDKFEETIIAFSRRNPFRPYAVVLLNGSRYEVDHPQSLAVRDGLGLFAAPGGVPVIFDNDGVNEIIGDLANRQEKD